MTSFCAGHGCWLAIWWGDWLLRFLGVTAVWLLRWFGWCKHASSLPSSRPTHWLTDSLIFHQKKTAWSPISERETPKNKLITKSLHSFCFISLFLWVRDLVPSRPYSSFNFEKTIKAPAVSAVSQRDHAEESSRDSLQVDKEIVGPKILSQRIYVRY